MTTQTPPAPTLADQVAEAVARCPSVARLSGGIEDGIATYLPGVGSPAWRSGTILTRRYGCTWWVAMAPPCARSPMKSPRRSDRCSPTTESRSASMTWTSIPRRPGADDQPHLSFKEALCAPASSA